MAVTRKITFKLKRGTAAQWAAAGDPVLAEGEPGVLVDPAGPETLKVGDGATPFSALPTVNPGPEGPAGPASTVPGPAGPAGTASPETLATIESSMVGQISTPDTPAHDALVSAAGGVYDPATAALLSDDGSATRAAASALTRLAPSPLQGATLTNTNVLVCDVVGGVAWGSYNGFFHSSTNGGATWTQRMALPVSDTLRGLRATADGEVVALFPQVIYKSSGWGGIGSTPTWTLKVTATGLARHSRFSFDGDGQKFIAGQYGPGAGQAWIDSKYAYISIDAGSTWTPAYNSDTVTANAPVDSHVHGCCYDPWSDRFYVSEGHSTSAGLWCSEDNGATWFLAPGLGTNPTNSVTGMMAGPTTIDATDDGLVCGSDDVIGGLYGVPRLADATKQRLQQTYFWRPNRTGTNGFGEKGFRDPATGLVYVAFESSGPAPIIAAGTANSGGLVWEWPAWTGTTDDFLESVVVVGGDLIAYGQEGGVKKQLLGKVGKPGTGLTTDTGGTRGGTAKDPTSVAAGRDASTASYIRSTATGVGSTSHQDGTATGYSATITSSRGTATGSNSQAGSQASAYGQDADATGTRSIAIGDSAKGIHQDSIALGANVSTTKTFQTAIGPRAIYAEQVAAEPSAPAANAGELYMMDDGTGKTELRVRFQTGGGIPIARQGAGLVVPASLPAGHSEAVKTTAKIVNNSTVFSADAELSIPVVAGTYLLRAVLAYDSATTADARFSLTVPASTTMLVAPTTPSLSTTSAASSSINRTAITASGATVVAGGAGAGTALTASLDGRLVVTTNGNVGISFAQNTADATDTTLQAGSWITLTKVA